MKRTAVLFAVLALFAWTVPVSAATPNVGQHIHIAVHNQPLDGVVIPRAPYTFNVTIKLHDQLGKATLIRVDQESTIRYTRAISLGPCSDCTLDTTVTVDFSKWPTGRHEMHWHVAVPSNDDGNRQFTTARSQVCVGSCSPNGGNNRPTPYNGGGSWYLGKYSTITLRSSEKELQPGHTIKVSVDQDAAGGCAFLNPDFHALYRGDWSTCWTGKGAHSVTIPATAAVGARFVLYAYRADGNAGLIRFWLNDGTLGPTSDYEYMSWWAKGGIVLP